MPSDHKSLPEITQNRSLETLNTLSVPSVAEYYALCESVDDIRYCLDWAKKKKCAVHVLGGGSNVLLAEHIQGLVIQPKLLGKSIQINNTNVKVSVSAGEDWHAFVTWCCEQGGYGIENLSLIPGTVGAAPVQNIGAYGVELMEFVDSVEVLNIHTNELQELSNKQCCFSYRDSIFKKPEGQHFMITELRLNLQSEFKARLHYSGLETFNSEQRASALSVAHAIAELRQAKLPDPADIPNAGSFFKNPIVSEQHYQGLVQQYPDLPSFVISGNERKIPAAWLIDHLGWKQKQVNEVSVHSKQALVVVNPKHKTLNDVMALAAAIQNEVKTHFDIALEIEPRLID